MTCNYYIKRITTIIIKVSFCLLLLLHTSYRNGYAQEIPLHGLSNNIIEAASGDIVSINLFVTRSFLQNDHINIEVACDKPLQLLTKSKSAITFGEEEKVYQSVKAFVPKEIRSNNKYRVVVSYKNDENDIIGADTCTILIQEMKRVNLFIVQQVNSIDRTTDTLVVPVRVVNGGNTPQTVTVVARLPQINSATFYKILNTELPPFLDTTIYLKRKVVREMFRHKSFEVTFTGLYSNGDIFGSGIATVQVAGSARSYIENQPLYKEADGTPGMMTLSARYLYTPFENYQLFGGSSFQFKNSMIRYSIDATAWKNNDIQPLIRNTYVNYEKNNSGIVVGNIQRNYELNLNGKGIAVYKEDKDKHNYIELGYIIGGFNLINNERIGDFNNGRSAWMNYSHIKDKFQVRASCLYDVSSFSYTQSALANVELGWVSTHQNITVIAGSGFARDTRAIDDTKPGFAGGLIYSLGLGKWYFSSNNYISTSYFPGYRRGAITADERVTLALENNNSIWAAFNYYNFQPDVLPGTPGAFNASFGTTRGSAGIDIRMSRAFSIGLSAINAREENNNSVLFGFTATSHMNSLRGEISLHYSNSALQCFGTVSSENGMYSTSLFPGVISFHSKNTLSFRYKFLTLATLYQHGYFHLTEVLNSIRYNRGEYTLLTVSPMLQQDFLHKKLEVMAGISYSSNSIFGSNTMVNIRVDYMFARKTKVYSIANLNKFNYQGYSSQVNNFETGFIRELPPVQVTAFTGSELTVSVYMDMNGNDILDAGDKAAPNRIVNINGIVLMTDPSGKVHLKHVPDSIFNISVTPTKEWYAPQQTINVRGNTSTKILLKKATRISGNINYKFDEFSYEVKKKMSGVAIVAKGTNDETYITKTDERGRFIFYLPEGTFNLSVRKEQLGKEIECVNDNMAVSVNNENTADVELLLKIKPRRVQVKKFGSFTTMNTEKK